MKFSKTVIPFTLVEYGIGYSPPHIQHALKDQFLNISSERLVNINLVPE